MRAVCGAGYTRCLLRGVKYGRCTGAHAGYAVCKVSPSVCVLHKIVSCVQCVRGSFAEGSWQQVVRGKRPCDHIHSA